MFLNVRIFLLLKIIFISLFIVLNIYNHGIDAIETEYFSAIAGLENLLKTEVEILKELQNYIDAATNHIDALKSEILTINLEHELAAQDTETYLNNPVNSYRLIKRLQNDWFAFEESIRNDLSTQNFLEAMKMHRQNLSFPTENEVYHAALALVRLQETYQLDVSQLASGMLNGNEYVTAMSWQDCFFLGHHLYELRDFNHTVPWLKQSMKLLTAQDYNEDPMSLDFMTVVASYHQEMGDFESALELIDYILDKDATREHMHETKKYLEEMLAKGIKKGSIHEQTKPQFDYHQTNEFKLYEKVCRSEVSTTPTQQRNLSCRFYTNNFPYRLLQPFKMEELFHDPYIVQFHDVIREQEIDVIKNIAAPKMARSMVQALNSTNEVVANYRTSKSAWFEYKTHEYMKIMLESVAHLSGLNCAAIDATGDGDGAAEDLQVANYGIGGHYEPHWDFFPSKESYDENYGNRIATAIFYLSDVEKGGGTAFPFLQLLVQPQRGSVVFWYNLHRSGEPDYRTRHGACPVLTGSKWIANIWLRERHQYLARPCGLEPDHEISMKYKDFG